MNEFVVIFLEVEHSRMLPSAQAPPASPASDSALSLEAFTRLLRQPTSLDAYLGKTTTSVTIETTSTNVHCYHLKHDGNRHPRVGDLCTRLIHAIVDYAIPRSEFSTALKETLATNSHYHMSRLRAKAANLFTNLANTGEGGELLLYLLAECFLGIPQLLCKMPLKTNSRMHFHGTDGIHGTVNPKTGGLALYWGESKLHATPGKAITACLTDLAPFVLASGGSDARQQRDLQLLSANLQLDDEILEQAILRYLDPADVNFLKLEYRGIAVVGFDEAAYTTLTLPCEESVIIELIKPSITSWHSSILTQINNNKLAPIEIELFCLPFPSVDDFRKAFLKELGRL